MAKSEDEIVVTGMNLQKFRTLSDKDRSEMIKDWVMRAFEAGLSEEQKDIHPSQRPR